MSGVKVATVGSLAGIMGALAVLADVATAATSAPALDRALKVLDEAAADTTAPEEHRSSVRIAAMALRSSAGHVQESAPALTSITQGVH